MLPVKRGIDIVRNKISQFSTTRNTMFMSKKRKKIYKLIILDEIDSMTIDAQGMLRKIIEEYSKTIRFCLICNEIDKVNEALQSRCTLYRFSSLTSKAVTEKLTEICTKEKVKYDEKSLEAIIRITKGDMRIAINWLQILCLTSSKKILSDEKIYKMAGFCSPILAAEIFDLLDKLYRGKLDLLNAIGAVTKIIDNKNLSLFNVVSEIKDKVLLADWKQQNHKIFILDHFSKLEMNEAVSVDVKNNIKYFCSLFALCAPSKN